MLNRMQEASGADEVSVRLPCHLDKEMVQEYLNLAQNHDIPSSYVRGKRRQWNDVDEFFGCGLSDFPDNTWMHETGAAHPDLGRSVVTDWISSTKLKQKSADESFHHPYMFLEEVGNGTAMHHLDLTHCCVVKPESPRMIPDPAKLRAGCERLRDKLSGFPWFSNNHADGGAVIGGDRLTALLHGTAVPYQNVCVLVITKNKEIFGRIVSIAIKSIKRAYPCVVTNRRFDTIEVACYNLDPKDNTYKCVELFKIIVDVFASPSHAAHWFDVDMNCIVYDGMNQWCTHAANRAFANGFMLLDEKEIVGGTTALRYAKHTHNYGYSVLAAGIPQAFMNTTLALCLIDMSKRSVHLDVFSVKYRMEHGWKVKGPTDISMTVAAAFIADTIVPYLGGTFIYAYSMHASHCDTLKRYTKYTSR